jgi:hypothetical protein
MSKALRTADRVCVGRGCDDEPHARLQTPSAHLPARPGGPGGSQGTNRMRSTSAPQRALRRGLSATIGA